MWDFFKSKGNLLLKVALLIFAVMLYMSAAKGISYVTLVFALMVIVFTPALKFIDRTAMHLVLFSVSYGIILLLREPNIRVLMYFVGPVSFYTFGRLITNKFSNRALLDFLAITIFLFGLKTYIATVIDIGEVGLINPFRAMNRSGIGDVDLAATLFGVNVSLGFVGLTSWIVRAGKWGPLRYLLPLAFFLSLLTVLHLVNRTGLAIMVFCIMAVLTYSSPKQSIRIVFWGVVAVALVIVLIPSLQGMFSDIGSAYEVREDELGGGTLTMGNRLWRWRDAIVRVFTDPMGWDGQAQYNFVHNMWLDVARLTGILPFVFIFLATVSGTRTVIKLYHKKNDTIIAVLVGLSVATFASSFMEPILEGFDLYFYLMCMFWGIASQYLIKVRYGVS